MAFKDIIEGVFGKKADKRQAKAPEQGKASITFPEKLVKKSAGVPDERKATKAKRDTAKEKRMRKQARRARRINRLRAA